MFVCVFSLHAELFSDKSNTHEFVNLVKELALPGELTQNRSYDFEFMQVEKPYESYVGANVRLRLVKTLSIFLLCWLSINEKKDSICLLTAALRHFKMSPGFNLNCYILRSQTRSCAFHVSAGISLKLQL